MLTEIRRLGPGDEAVLRQLAVDDHRFGGGGNAAAPALAPVPLDPDVATAFLADPAVWHWGAFDPAPGGTATELVGHLHAFVHRIRHGSGFEVVLFDIAVRQDRRRRGIGRGLLAALHEATAASPCRTIWLLADNPEARAFYEAAGYLASPDQPTYLERAVAPA